MSNQRRISADGGIASPPTPPTSGEANASTITSPSVRTSSGGGDVDGDALGQRRDRRAERMSEHVLEAGEPVAAGGQLRVHGRLGEHRDLGLQRRVAGGEPRLHVVEDAGIERLAEADADHLVGRRPRAGVDGGAAPDRDDERPQAGVPRRGAVRDRDHLPRFGLIDPGREIRGQNIDYASSTCAAMIMRWTLRCGRPLAAGRAAH